MSGARGSVKPSEYPTPLSRYREVISSRPAVLIAAAGSYLQRWKESFFSESGWHRESIVPLWMVVFFFDRKNELPEDCDPPALC